jgi:gamma-glutamylcyclotransferase (GGCT)/AIG2-like uncharacterized protein YtfP
MSGYRVFVYGTLKPGHGNWDRLLRGRVRPPQAARVAGELLHLPVGYPTAVAGTGWVHGYLVQVPDAELLRAIDRLEGYDPHRPAAQQHYRRRRVPCYSRQGAPLGRVFAYFMERQQAEALGGEPVPDGIWQGAPKPA